MATKNQVMLSRVLFRSLLRWVRQPEITQSKFVIDPKAFSCEQLFPVNTMLNNATGVQAAVFHCFRQNSGFDAAKSANSGATLDTMIDLGFSVLKRLNEYTPFLKERLQQHLLHSTDSQLSHAIYRIGTVVQDRVTKIRGVVIGWEIIDYNTPNSSKKEQKVEILYDKMDVAAFFESSDSTIATLRRFLLSKDIEQVKDYHFQRIFHDELSYYFAGYDEKSRRYIPMEHLLYLYPKDFDGEIEAQNKLPVGSADETAEMSKLKRETFQAVQESLSSLANELKKEAFEKFFPQLAMDSQSLASRKEMTEEELTEAFIVQDILGMVLSEIQLLSSGNNSSTQESSKDHVKFDQPLRRGGYFKKLPKPFDPSSCSFITSYNDEMSTVRPVYNQLKKLSDFIAELDANLQVRFQSRGIAHMETLSYSYSPSETSQSDSSIQHTSLTDSTTIKLADELTEPSAIFPVGSIVRHRKFGYRGVIVGYDQRPLVNCSKWEGVVDLPLGQEQPFYRVIPDESDIKNFLNDKNAFRPFYYTAQENLEIVTDSSQMIIQHRNIPIFFQGWDANAQKFRLSHKLKYSFPSDEMKLSLSMESTAAFQEKLLFVSQSFSPLNQLKSETLVNSMKTYEKIDMFLLAIRSKILRWLGETRKSQGRPPQDHPVHTMQMKQLFLLLKNAPNRSSAMGVENMMWLVWLCHDDVNVRACMRMGMSYMKRENWSKAKECFAQAVKCDKLYPEAHNKLAAVYHALDEHVQCIDEAKQVLRYHPGHVGALTGLARSYLKMEEDGQAVMSIRTLLDLHPWAPNLPTDLKTILNL